MDKTVRFVFVFRLWWLKMCSKRWPKYHIAIAVLLVSTSVLIIVYYEIIHHLNEKASAIH